MLPSSSNVLLILGACAIAGVALGFFIDWIMAKVKRTRRTSGSSLAKAIEQPARAIAEDTDHLSSEQHPGESDLEPDYRQETTAKAEDDDWLNSGVPEVSTKDIKSDDERWMDVENAEVEEIPPDLYKQRDEEWLNAATDVSLESPDEPLPDRTRANRPQIKFSQEGTRLDITINLSGQSAARSGQTTFNVRIGLPSHLSARRAQGLFDLEITTDDLSAQNEGLQDVTTVRPIEESSQGRLETDQETAGQLESPIGQAPQALGPLPIGPVGAPVAAENRALLDEISVRPVEGAVAAAVPLVDSLLVGPAAARAVETNPLMDEITVKPVEGPIAEAPKLVDSMLLESAESLAAESHPLLDEITIRPSPGPIDIEYDLIDDLITKHAIRAKIARQSANLAAAIPPESPVKESEPSGETGVIDQTIVSGEEIRSTDDLLDRPLESPIPTAEGPADTTVTPPKELPALGQEASADAAITRPTKTPDQKAEVIQPVSITDITEFLKEKRGTKQAQVASAAPDSRSATLKAPAARRVERLSTRAEGISVSAELRRAAIKALATLRIYNHSEFYVQDTDLTGSDASVQGLQNGGFTIKILNTPAEFDELIRAGYDLALNIRTIKRGLKKGMVAFLTLADKELASVGWACVTEGSKRAFKGYPYNRDLDKEACIVGDWTNPRFLDSDAAALVRNKRHQLLRDKGFTTERSVADAGTTGNHHRTESQGESQPGFRRRTYSNVSLPGLFGVEIWKEHSPDETETKPTYQMTTLLVLVLPLPPKAGDLARESMV